MDRAYSLLSIKAIDGDRRILRGVATTPSTDRMGDVVEPLGVQFKNPMPLLWQHRHDQPVGTVRFGKPTKDGIEFEARIASTEEPGTLKNRLDEAWQSVKLGLVKAVSIGFKALEWAFLDDDKGDGIHFLRTEVLELSLVTIPANAEALITDIKFIKSLDAPALAATGYSAPEYIDLAQRAEVAVRKIEAASGSATNVTFHSGVSEKQITPKAKDKKMPKTIAEQISAFEATRAALVARNAKIMEASAESGETLATAEQEEYDTNDQKVADVDAHLVRLRKHEKQMQEQAKPVQETNGKDHSDPHAVVLRGPGRVQSVKRVAPPGTGFIRLAIATMYGKGDTMRAIQRAKEWEGDFPELQDILRAGVPSLMDGQKAAIGAGTTTDATWASPLIAYNILASEFIELLRPLTVIGRIPNLRRVPFNIQMPATTTGTSVNWVGENAPKPVTNMVFATVTLRWAKAAGIVVLTDELVRFSNPAAESVVRSDLTAAMVQFLDRQFLDPSVSEVTNVSPASITQGATTVTPTGTNEAALRTDVATLLSGMLSNNLNLSGGVWIMTQQQAIKLSLMVNSLGQQSFAGLGPEGGTLLGYPVVATENIPSSTGSPTEGYPIIFALAPEIMLADDGQTVIDASNQASVQMDSAPDSPPTASTNMVSLWQMNMVGLRAERWINWKKRRSTAVAYITSALYR